MKQLYCIPKPSQMDNYLSYSKKYNAGFEYNDFFLPSVLDDKKRVEEIISYYCGLDRDRSEDTLHGVFLDICVNSADPLIYKASDYRIRQSMDIAEQLGVKAVIFHTNYIANFKLKSYRDSWLDMNEKYWRNILKDYPRLSVYLENMFDDDPILLMELAQRMNDEKRFAVCHDLAHSFISSTPLPEWIRKLTPYTAHLHINDNNKIEDSHHPVGSMNLPWEDYNNYMNSLPNSRKPTVLIEVRTYEELIQSTEYMIERHMYPFQ